MANGSPLSFAGPSIPQQNLVGQAIESQLHRPKMPNPDDRPVGPRVDEPAPWVAESLKGGR